jgi:uncharacterized protein YeaO (DUF488 family)
MSGGSVEVTVRRVYEPAERSDGFRALVDRLWPRGVSRDSLALDEWCRDVAPSTELRRWYGHDPERFAEFARRYRLELVDDDHRDALRRLRDLAREGPLTLLTATKVVDISAAAVLADVLAE